MSAVYRDTPPAATSPWALPGDYSVTLTANGERFTQPLKVKIDPRVKASSADLELQFELSKKLYETRPALETLNSRMTQLNKELTKAKERAGNNAVSAQIEALSKDLQKKFASLNARPGTPLELEVLSNLRTLFAEIQNVDVAPTPALRSAVEEVLAHAPSVLKQWAAVEADEIPELNRQLEAAGFPKMKMKTLSP